MTVAETTRIAAAPDLKDSLIRLLGRDAVLDSADELDFYSSDVFDQKLLAQLVLRPATVEGLAEAVSLCTRAGNAVFPRGGGFSYTGGYLPTQDKSVIVDLGRLNRILEINEVDMFVSVEAGVTWSQLHEALSVRGLRTPYWGTVSGFHATIGGGLAQGSTHFGSAEFGMSGDSCLGLEVVLADGSLVKTGSGSNLNAPSPFFRGYGPDLTGLFLNDTGALGIKVRATLKLIRAPKHQRYVSAAFKTLESQLSAMAEVSRQRLASECGGWDPALVRRFASDAPDLLNDLKYLGSVIKTGRSPVGGLVDAARIALAGRRDWNSEVFLMHVTLDEFSAAAADEKRKAVEQIVATNGGQLIPASYPRAHRARPFTSLFAQPWKPERTVPTHGLCPHSRALEVARDVYDYFETQATLTQKYGITWSLISSTVGTTATLIEPLICYPDPRGAHYARNLEPEKKLRRFGESDPAVIEAVRAIRKGVVGIFLRHGCAHLQIGKAYPYREGRDSATWALMQAIKSAVDPCGLLNPGSLGL
jgi:FAD/FMN-containing dehydrogenase